MEPISWVVVGVVAALATGFGAGWGLKPDSTADALEAQAVALADLQASTQQVVEASNRPIVIDAELRSELAQVPVQCRKDAGGDPRSPECAWATCLQFGQSSAQRPECRAVEVLMLQVLETQHECD